MKKENILVAAIICVVIAGSVLFMKSKSGNIVNAGAESRVDVVGEQNLSLTAAKSSNINWQSYNQGVKNAKAQNKPVFLYFHADWCKYCTKLKKTTFTDKDVLNYLNDNFISIAIDTEKQKDFARQWGIKGLPNLWFLRADSSKISNIPGYVEADHFLNILKYIRTQSFDKMSFSDFLKKI